MENKGKLILDFCSSLTNTNVNREIIKCRLRAGNSHTFVLQTSSKKLKVCTGYDTSCTVLLINMIHFFRGTPAKDTQSTFITYYYCYICCLLPGP